MQDAEPAAAAVPEVNVAVYVAPEVPCNISDEISKTSNWRHLGGESSDSLLRNRLTASPVYLQLAAQDVH
jgi:hypothetical protein